MPPFTIMISVAIPEEYGPLKTIFSPSMTIKGKIPVYEAYLTLPDMSSKEGVLCRCVLVVTGMGPNFWFKYGPPIINRLRPDLLISMGFCGELTAPVNRSGLYLPTLFTPPPSGSCVHLPALSLTPPLAVLKALGPKGVTISKAISVPIYVPKSRIGCSSAVPLILDMESYFTALTASLFCLPFIPIRARTDGPEEEIPFDVNRLLDSSGFVSIRRVVFCLLERPQIAVSFLRYYRRSVKAARQLKDALTSVLSLPLRELISGGPPRVVKDSDYPGND